MGRRKIEIQPITHERNRSVTFLKRKNGLFKKAYELGVLCSVGVAVIVFEERPGHHLKLYQYGSSDIDEIIQRHLHYDGEKDTRGPQDFSGNAPSARAEDIGDGDDDDGDDDPDDSIPLPTRGSKRRGDEQLKQPGGSDLNGDLAYTSSRTHVQQPRLLPPSISVPQHHQQHPISSDRLGPMHTQQPTNKRPRLGLAAPGLTHHHSRSPTDDSHPSSGSPASSSRGARYIEPLSRGSFGAPGYLPLHSPQSANPHSHAGQSSSTSSTSASVPHHHRPQSQYSPFYPSSAPGGGHYGQGGATPPAPSFIPLQSQDFTSSATRGRSASGNGSGSLGSRTIYGTYRSDSGLPSAGGGGHGSGGGGGGSSSGGGGGGGGASGDLFSAFIDASEQARINIARRSSSSSLPSAGGVPQFGLDWPVHSGPPTERPPSKSGSRPGSSMDHDGDRESLGSAGSAGGGGGGSGGPSGGGGPGAGPDWLDFLSGANNAPPPTG